MAERGKAKSEYIVHKGRNPGVYKDWSAAKEQVDRYPGNCYEKAGSSGKHYIVYDGSKPGVYDSWNKAHENVCGYSKNSYERCDDRDAAESKYRSYRDSHWD